MAVRTISTKLAVEGEAEYKQKIASCNSELKTLKSSLALVQSEYKNNANSMEALTAKGEALSAMQTAQAKKVAELEKALENCQKAQTAYADRVAAAEANVSKYEQALAELKDSTGDTSEEQAALTAELEKWKEELANAEAGQNAAERGVENWQQQLNKAKIELNETNEAISENDKYLDEAKKSTDGCATSIDKFGNKVKDSKDGITQLAAALAAAGVATRTRGRVSRSARITASPVTSRPPSKVGTDRRRPLSARSRQRASYSIPRFPSALSTAISTSAFSSR